LLGDLPGGTLLTIGAILLIAIFFITSADSGALVMGMISTGGHAEPKNWLRIFWALAAAAVAIALLLANGLQAIQTAAILTAVPFSVVIILMCISTAKAFHREHVALMRAQRKLARDQMTAHVTEHVQDSMADSVQEHYQEHVAEQIHDSVQEHYQEHFAEQVTEAVEAQLSERLASEEETVQDTTSSVSSPGKRK
ncbi:BCCT family transporter, partial [Paenarthrobacter sp. CM16]|uniref:BCCT family transporter n=1 Tax=Paenarthrobacter sp. CM16 TaxID=2738447 RepID=UPI0015517480